MFHQFLKSQFSEAHFELAENLVLTKLDTELGLAQPQLVPPISQT